MKKYNERPFNLVGFTSKDYEIWCKIKGLPSYSTEVKKVFFAQCVTHKLEKKNGILYEGGKKLCKERE